MCVCLLYTVGLNENNIIFHTSRKNADHVEKVIRVHRHIIESKMPIGRFGKHSNAFESCCVLMMSPLNLMFIHEKTTAIC